MYYSIPEITLLYAASTILFSIGIHRILLPGNLYGRDQPQDFGTGFCPPSWQLPEKYVEYHGFCCCCDGVSQSSISKTFSFLFQKGFLQTKINLTFEK